MKDFITPWRSIAQRPYDKNDFKAHMTLVPSSLTKIIRDKDECALEQLDKGMRFPTLAEATKLNAPHDQYMLTRTVMLTGPTMQVFARSVSKDISFWKQIFDKLGNKPMGDYLFTRPDLKRSSFDVARIHAHSAEGSLIQPYLPHFNTCYARRSTLTLEGNVLLITEWFL